ncbi:MAG: hypothetical protein QGI17_14950 [Arenicellales bacterium]|nr:hypothetical protein [Arenicellales bacterium]
MWGKIESSESFVARLWLESGANGEPMWRGHIRHVQGEEETYFQDLEKMIGFIEQVTNVPGPQLKAE